MINQDLYDNHIKILKNELIPALGCTEPAAIALAAAKARQVLGILPDRIEVACSRNIVKNAKGVQVPNSLGMKGIAAAAILGMLSGNADAGLQVLEFVRPEHIIQAREMLSSDFCTCSLLIGTDALQILVTAYGQNHVARVEIAGRHDNLTLIELDGRIIKSDNLIENEDDPSHTQSGPAAGGDGDGDRTLLTVRNILSFAEEVRIADVQELLDRQIAFNTAISDEGLLNDWGVSVGRILLNSYGQDIRTRARARAAAGSDARMSGCSLPVIINSGSGNQGMTLSLPVIEYARELKIGQEKLYRALVISNLVAIRQKNDLGRLSAYCGAVSAAAGSGAGIAYLHGASYDEIANTIVNTIANVGGMICDGAKPSCAAKISSAIDAAIMAFEMSHQDKTYAPGDGLVKNGVEQTIASVGRMGREGMKSTDDEILKIMIEQS